MPAATPTPPPACYKSLDGGATWTKCALPGQLLLHLLLLVSPTDHNTVFAGTLYGVCRSTDAGLTWTQQSTNNYNYRIVTAPGDPNTMYSAAYTTVYRSTDAGLTWSAPGSGIQGTTVRTVLTVPGENSSVYCGSSAGMFKSTDYGLTWLPANNGIAHRQDTGRGGLTGRTGRRSLPNSWTMPSSRPPTTAGRGSASPWCCPAATCAASPLTRTIR